LTAPAADSPEEEKQKKIAAAAAVAAPAASIAPPPSIAKLFLPVDTREQVHLPPAPLSPVHAATPPPSPHSGAQPQPIACDVETELARAEDEEPAPVDAPGPNRRAAGFGSETAVLASLGLTAEGMEEMPEVWEQQVLSTSSGAPAACGENGLDTRRSGSANYEKATETEQQFSHALQSLGLTDRDADDMLEAWEVVVLQRATDTAVLPNGNGSHP
jgi:hypothetical protein